MSLMRKLEQLGLKTSDREAVRRASSILKQQFPVERVVLFGSKATGRDTPESDIDLLVLTRQPLDQAAKARIVEALFDLQMELRVVVSVLVASVEEWEHGYFQVLPIHREIERDGVLA